MLTRFIISPPVGAYLGMRGATRVLGSYTWEKRSGRAGQILRTVRPVPGGWVNAVGLRNTGIRSVRPDPKFAYSLAGIDDGDWERMANHLYAAWPGIYRWRVELNLSCPNVHEYGFSRKDADAFTRHAYSFEVIAKLPPIDEPWTWGMADACVESGAEYLHFSNTLPSPGGGISGDALFRVNIRTVEQAVRRYPNIPIIAGGGIRNAARVRDYENAGASHFSLASGYLRYRMGL